MANVCGDVTAMNEAATRLATVRDTLRAVFRARHAPTDAELRAVAAALALPYVELWARAGEVVDRPRLTARRCRRVTRQARVGSPWP